MKKRLLSFLLAVCMTLTLLPAQTLAAEIPGGETNPSEETAGVVSVETMPEEEAPNQDTPEGGVPEEESVDEPPAAEESAVPESMSESEEPQTELFDGETSGSCGENLNWSFDEATGTLTISGSGPMTNYNNYSTYAPWFSLKVADLVLEEGITKIGDYAFSSCDQLTSVVIPEGVTYLSSTALRGCTALESVTLPASLTNVGTYAFMYCEQLTTAGPADGDEDYDIKFYWTETIPSGAFECTHLTSLTVPEGVTGIGGGALRNCTKLIDVEFPSTLQSIGGEAFKGCESLTHIEIPAGVTQIGYNSFTYCPKLKYVALPACKNSTTNSLIDDLFSPNPNLTTAGPINGGFDIEFLWDEDDPELSAKLKSMLNRCLLLKSVTLPKGVTDISGMFYSCGNLESVTLPESVPEIGNEAFYGCARLTGVEFLGGVGSIGWQSFKDCVSLTEISIPKTVTYIDGRAFWGCTALRSVNIPGNVERIASSAFEGCANLETVTVQEGVESIDTYAFKDCVNLKTLALPSTMDYLGSDMLDNCSSLEELTVPLNQMQRLQYCMTGDCSKLTTVGPADSDAHCDIKVIWTYDPLSTFQNCPFVEEVTVPEGVTTLADNMFYNCPSLRKVTLPEGLQTIGNYAFDSCTALKELAIPEGVTSIGWSAFEDSGLENVFIPASVTSIGSYAFYDIENTVTITCYANSYAEYYAKLNKLTYKALDQDDISVFTQLSTNVPNGVVAGRTFWIQAACSTRLPVSSLRIVLPEGVSLAETDGIWLDGKKLASGNYTFEEETRTVTIPLTGQKDVHTLYIYCRAQEGTQTIGGALALEDGTEYSLGTVVIPVEPATLDVPEKVGRTDNLLATGTAEPGAAVTLLVDDKEAGTGTANSAGRWKISFGLGAGVVSGSKHTVYAQIRPENAAEEVTTAEKEVFYQVSPVAQPASVTMYNTGDNGAQETVFDFTDINAANQIRFYRMWPSHYPTFTFKVAFSDEGVTPDEVSIITVNSAKKERLIKASYDAASRCWVGSSRYTDFQDAPAWVGVAYSDGSTEFRSNLLSATAIMDPSGYVYEAVPSNRLEGVEAKISYQEGDKAIDWNAREYGQINPQTTGPDGSYYWDVPTGNWKVSFSKDGYDPAETEWLPVPPPQVGIGVAMVSRAAPEVKYAAVHSNGAEITFSQYMNIDSVRGAITLTNVDNATSVAVSSIEALDEEYDAEVENQYATRFRVTSSDLLSGSVRLDVSQSALNYAGTAMETAYSSPFEVEAALESLTVNAEDKFVNMETAKQTVIYATLAPRISDREILIENLTPQIIQAKESVTTDEYGQIFLDVTALLPGAGILRLVDPISGLSDTVSIQIEPAPEPELSVTAWIEDGVLAYQISKAPGGNAQLIIASYQNGQMVDIKIIEKPSLTGTLNVSDGSCTLFLVEAGTIKPLCPAFSGDF